MHWGINPDMMIGHSIGEFVAACLSGVFSLEEGLKLVVKRGELMQNLPEGSMISVILKENELKNYLDDGLSIATINSPQNCVVSGNKESMDKFKNKLDKSGILYKELHTSHAFHSPMMNPILREFEKSFESIDLKSPKIPYVSNLTGTWITAKDATSSSYWSDHLRHTVRFEEGLTTLLKNENILLIEVGPGKTLCSFVNQHPLKKEGHKSINILRHVNDKTDDSYHLLSQLGNMWAFGQQINWEFFYEEEQRSRIPLPTYPFEKQKYWINLPDEATLTEQKAGDNGGKENITDWFYVPQWEQSPNASNEIHFEKKEKWLIFSENKKGISNSFIEKLSDNNQEIITVFPGERFKNENNRKFIINPSKEDDYYSLFNELNDRQTLPSRIIHFWTTDSKQTKQKNNNLDSIDYFNNLGLYSLMNIAKSIGKIENNNETFEIVTITAGLYAVTGEEELHPEIAPVLGCVKIIPLEYKNINCRNIDISVNYSKNRDISTQLLSEILSSNTEKIVAYRGIYRWIQGYKAINLEENKTKICFKPQEVYLITGGFGGMGYTIAKHLAETYKAKLILIGRTSIPSRQEWDDWLTEHALEDNISIRINKIKQLEELGGEVLFYNTDVADYKSIKYIIHKTKTDYGDIKGVFHTAGLADYEGIIQRRSKEKTERILAPKIRGTINLYNLLKDEKLDFFICFSSLGNQLYSTKFGQVGYNAANEFLDAFVYFVSVSKGKTQYKTINWNDWMETGMTVDALKRKQKGQDIKFDNLLVSAIKPQEGIEVLIRVLQSDLQHVLISKEDINILHKKIQLKRKNISNENKVEKTSENEKNLKPRPRLSSKYIKPSSEVEKQLVEIFQNFFGYSEIGIADDFFELGGDSLKAIIIIQKIQNEFNSVISLTSFLNHSTISKLATLLKKEPEKKIFSIKQESFFYGNNSGKLFGICSYPLNSQGENIGIIVCSPLGQEQIISYPAYLNLSAQLATYGYYVFRFNYPGCGDSDGEMINLDRKKITDSISVSLSEFKSKHNLHKIYLIGLRLGASFSAIFKNENSLTDGIILWNPVINGKEYIKEIKNQHKEWYEGSFVKQKRKTKDSVEILGFEYSVKFIDEINKIDLLKLSFQNTLIITRDENSISKGKAWDETEIIHSNSPDFWIKQRSNREKKIIPTGDIEKIIQWLDKKNQK